MSLLAWASPASAYDYSGRLNLGLFSTKETHVDPSADVYSNDAQAALFSSFLDVNKFGPFHNEFTFDFRDRYDSFGSVDPDSPRLVASNEPQLRQLAIKYPFEDGSLYWAVGRVPVADADVLGNDGAVIAFKVIPKLQLGVFGGLYPEQRDNRTVQLADEDKQGGFYMVYQDTSRTWKNNLYATTSFVLRQPTEKEAADEAAKAVQPDGATQTPAATGTTTDDETPVIKNKVFWYTNVVYQSSPASRLTYLSQVDVQPEMHIRNLWASYYRQVTPRFSGTISGMRLDLTEYERQRDLRDTLPSSIYTQGRLDLRYKLSRYLMLDGNASDGARSLDGKSKTEANAKLVATSLFASKVSLFGGGGYRKNFLSHDTIARAGGTVYTRSLELSLTEQYITETHDETGEVLHPLISEVSLGAFLGDQVMASLGVEYAKDERVTVISGLLTLGFRFGNRQPTPVRDRAPALERL